METDRVESVGAQLGVSHQDLMGGREGKSLKEGEVNILLGGRKFKEMVN